MADEFIFEELQGIITKRLSGLSWFVDIPVIAEDVGADVNQLISDRVEAKIGEIGTVVIVLPVVPFSLDSEDTPGLFFNLRMPIRVVENPVLNRADSGTKKTALQTVHHVIAGMHFFSDPDFPDIGMFRMDSQAPFRRVPDLTRIIYDINLKTNGGIIVV